MLKMTGRELEKISYIAKKYAKANNKYMKNYETKKLSKYISYLDTVESL